MTCPKCQGAMLHLDAGNRVAGGGRVEALLAGRAGFAASDSAY